MPDILAINLHLQERLEQEWRDEVAAVEAANWLDDAGLLRDSRIRKGLPLRICQRCLQSRQEECPISKPVSSESKNRLIVILIEGFFAALSILKFRQKILLARQGNRGIFFIYKPCKFTEHLEDVLS